MNKFFEFIYEYTCEIMSFCLVIVLLVLLLVAIDRFKYAESRLAELQEAVLIHTDKETLININNYYKAKAIKDTNIFQFYIKDDTVQTR